MSVEDGPESGVPESRGELKWKKIVSFELEGGQTESYFEIELTTRWFIPHEWEHSDF